MDYEDDISVIYKTKVKFAVWQKLTENKNLLLIGHNPGLNDFVNEINNSVPFSFPTSALCHLITNKSDKLKLEFRDFTCSGTELLFKYTPRTQP